MLSLVLNVLVQVLGREPCHVMRCSAACEGMMFVVGVVRRLGSHSGGAWYKLLTRSGSHQGEDPILWRLSEG